MADATSPEQASKVTGGFKGAATRGAMWTIVQQLSTSAIRLGGNLVLTRLLFPEAFGLLALTQTLFFAVQMLTDVGLRDSVIRHERGDDPEFLDTVWTLKVLRGTFISLIVAVFAIPYASFYNEPGLVAMIWALAGSGVIDSLGSTKALRLSRHLALGRLVALELSMQVLTLAVMMFLAWKLRSAWALVGGHMAGALFHTIASFFVLPGRNDRFRLEPKARHDVTRYGRWIVVSSALTFMSSSADTLVFAKYGGVGAIGVYAVASNLASFPANVLSSLAERVVFPLYSRYNTEGRDLRATFDQVSRPLLVLGGWGIATVVAIAHPLIETLYDSRYNNAGPMLRILALAAWFELLAGNIASVFKALGSPQTVAIATAGRVAVLVLLLAPITKYFGMHAGLWVLAGSSAARWLVSGIMLTRGSTAHWRSALIATAWVVLSGWTASEASQWVGGNKIVTGLLGFVIAAAFWIWPAIAGGLFDLARGMLGLKRAPA